MELSSYLRLLLRGWLLIAICSLAGVAIAAGYVLTQPPVYVATAAVTVTPSTVRDLPGASVGSTFAENSAATLATLIDTPFVLREAKQRLGTDRSIADLERSVRGDVAPGTPIVQVTASTSDPQLSAGLANAVAAALNTAVQRLNPNAGNNSSIVRTTTVLTATPPTSAASPDVPLDLAIGLAAGFAIGIATLLVVNGLRPRIRNANQAAEVSGAPVLGVVQSRPRTGRSTGALALDRSTPYRAVREEVLSGPSDRRMLVIAGVGHDVEVADIARQTASALGFVARRTLLVVADTVRPTAVSERQAGRPGLTDVLRGTVYLAEVVVHVPGTGIWCLWPGTASEELDDLLASPAAASAALEMRSGFDRVVVSADDVLTSVGARSLGRLSDAVVLAYERDRTSVEEARTARELLDRDGTTLLGTLLVVDRSSAGPRRADGPSHRDRNPNRARTSALVSE